MVSFFKDKSSFAVFAAVILSLCIHAHFLIAPPQILADNNDGLLHYFLQPFKTIPSIAIAAIYHMVVVLQALRLNYLMNDARMFAKTGYTTAAAYILLTALLPEWNNLSDALIANSFVIWVLFRIIKIYGNPHIKTLLFNIGLIASSTVLLYYAAVPLLIIVFIALAILRAFRINEWLVLLLGICTPFYFYAGYLFLNDKLSEAKEIANGFAINAIHPQNIAALIIVCVVAGLSILSGIYFWQKYNTRMVVQIRKNWSIMFLLLLLFIPMVFFLKNAWPFSLLLACVPAAAFVSNAFLYPQKNFVAAVFFWFLAVAVIYNSWH